MNDIPAAATRVVEAAESLGLPVSVRIMAETTRTAEEAAAACGCAPGAIVKSLIFQGRTSGRAYLFLVSGKNRLSEKKAAAATGEPVVRPDARFVRTVTGFAIGGIPPIGHLTPLVPFIDEDLLHFETVWAAAGTPNAVFPIDPRALLAATGGVAADVREETTPS